MSMLQYLQEAGGSSKMMGDRLVSYQLMPDGVLVHARDDQREVTYLVGWLSLEKSKVNPLLIARDMVLRRLSGAPTNGGGHG